jgi:threonine dehydrogenase-like Zn-dependent dehydrogenase
MPPGEPQQPKRKKDKSLRGAILYGPRDVRFDERATPSIIESTDAIISLSMTCICGSDLWPYRGLNETEGPTPMGHEYCGIVEEIGSDVTWINRGQFVIGSFFASDNTCPHCRAGYQTSCEHMQPVIGAQSPILRVPLADGTLVANASGSFRLHRTSYCKKCKLNGEYGPGR